MVVLSMEAARPGGEMAEDLGSHLLIGGGLSDCRAPAIGIRGIEGGGGDQSSAGELATDIGRVRTVEARNVNLTTLAMRDHDLVRRVVAYDSYVQRRSRTVRFT
jgi:hypothetical protein